MAKKLSEEIVHFFQNQGCVTVSSIDKNGFPHSACKGVVKISREGKVHLLDLYRGETLKNLEKNARISITAIDEHNFVGFCLKGRADIVPEDKIQPQLIKAWEDRITSRLTRRLLKNIQEQKGHPRHPEILLPRPAYMIEMEVEEIVDLTPHQMKAA